MNSQQNIRQEIGMGSEQQTNCSPIVETSATYYIDVVALMADSQYKQFFRNVKMKTNCNGNILIASVCEGLKEQGFNTAGMGVSYYSPKEQLYVFAGKAPIGPEKDGISIYNLWGKWLTLKFRRMQTTLEEPLQDNAATNSNQEMPRYSGSDNHATIDPPPTETPDPIGGSLESEAANNPQNTNSPIIEQQVDRNWRWDLKERIIGPVVEKVYEWREIYNMMQDEHDNEESFSLSKAAEIVGMSKEAIDYYSYRIFLGKSFGFNFSKHKDDKFAVLCTFVNRISIIEELLVEKRQLLDLHNFNALYTDNNVLREIYTASRDKVEKELNNLLKLKFYTLAEEDSESDLESSEEDKLDFYVTEHPPA
ncbi:unnamed protein product [Moneuplotes crassus]|uniref:Uncharacterized protein n=1 Tax=Euplotes crassus TaxID=5936 RepID=A0AAD1ULK3_EUPCR|nr:unnamed protein product [Moneuplotes crassus]